MSGSYRLLITAACGIALFITLGIGALFGALYAPHYSYQSAHPANRSTNAEQQGPSQIDRDRAGLPYFAERIASGTDPEDGTEREKRDLAAQESMSVWAFWMLVVTTAGVAVTSIGTGFLLWQIILTRRAVEDTGKATKAMERQNDIAEAAQRPWVDVALEPEWTLSYPEKLIISAIVTVSNSGQTPTRAMHIGTKIIPYPAIDDGTYGDFHETPISDHRKIRSGLLPRTEFSDQELWHLA